MFDIGVRFEQTVGQYLACSYGTRSNLSSEPYEKIQTKILLSDYSFSGAQSVGYNCH